jgi:hypothetical protein
VAGPQDYGKFGQSSRAYATEGANWVRAQTDDALAFDTGRPAMRLGIPVELYHEVFKQFKMDIQNARLPYDVMPDLASRAACAAKDLCYNMSHIFDREIDQVEAFHDAIIPLWGRFDYRYHLGSSSVFNSGFVGAVLLVETISSRLKGEKAGYIFPVAVEHAGETGEDGDIQQRVTRAYDMLVKQTKERNPSSTWAHAGFPMFLLTVEGKCQSWTDFLISHTMCRPTSPGFRCLHGWEEGSCSAFNSH